MDSLIPASPSHSILKKVLLSMKYELNSLQLPSVILSTVPSHYLHQVFQQF